MYSHLCNVARICVNMIANDGDDAGEGEDDDEVDKKYVDNGGGEDADGDGDW